VEVNDISYRNTIQIGYAGVWRNNEFSQAEKLPQDAELVSGRGGEPYSQSLYQINENGNVTITNPEAFTDEVGQPALIDYKEGENHQLSMELSATEDLEISARINGETKTTILNITGTSDTEREEAIARPVNIQLGNLEAGQVYTADITFETVETGKTRTEKFSFTAE
jgi:hypothetical protein